MSVIYVYHTQTFLFSILGYGVLYCAWCFHLGISLESEESEYNAYMFYQLLEERTSHSHALVEDIKVTPDLGRIISHLWSDKGIQEAFTRACEYQLSDCAHYFLNNVERLSDPAYVPTTHDILHTRVKTCGIVEVKFIIKVKSKIPFSRHWDAIVTLKRT